MFTVGLLTYQDPPRIKSASPNWPPNWSRYIHHNISATVWSWLFYSKCFQLVYFPGIWWRVCGGGNSVGLPAGGGPGLRRGRALPGPGPTQHHDLRPARVLGRPGGAPLPPLRGRFFQSERGKSRGSACGEMLYRVWESTPPFPPPRIRMNERRRRGSYYCFCWMRGCSV
jgi:hypothetical protein